MQDTFKTRSTLDVDGQTFHYFRLDALKQAGLDVSRLPFSLKILLENLLRHEDGVTVTADDVRGLASWSPAAAPEREIAFRPARVLLQDFTGVPAIVDLAAMRDAMKRLGGDPSRINPLQPVELVIDHSVQVDAAGSLQAFAINADYEFQRNRERYTFLRWGQNAFDNFRVVPPDTGIVHQVNLEHLARVVFDTEENGLHWAYPDTLVGTDSHTTMVNGMGVLGWGVGGIEAEAAMLGQPISMLVPRVVGFKLHGALREGATATDLVLTITQMLRKRGVVGMFVEYCGDGLANLPVADRATIGNMSPEYGATCGLFPIDAETLRYLELTGRSPAHIKRVEAYARAQGMFREAGGPEALYSDTLELDLATVEPSLAGPRRPQDRIPLKDSKAAFARALQELQSGRKKPQKAAASKAATATANGTGQGQPKPTAAGTDEGAEQYLRDGSVVIAAITSCTNTSNPSVLIGAGLLARNAVERGLSTRPWVKASLAPGSKVVTSYLVDAGLDKYLDQLRFNLVGYGCTTCIGNSGPLDPAISETIDRDDLVAAAVLSGNRNFEGRINADVRANYLMSPPLVVAYALAGSMDVDLYNEPLGQDRSGQPVFLKDIWPAQREIEAVIARSVRSEMFQAKYAEVFQGDERWSSLPGPEGDLYPWDEASTYIKNPPYFAEMGVDPTPIAPISGARALAVLGDSITTDHISPAGSIPRDGPAGRYLIGRDVAPADFNSFGSRRGNDAVMVRGTFANIRLRNRMAPGTEGGWTRHWPSGDPMTIFDAAERYAKEGTPLLILAGKEYGSGSSRDWAAKGTLLLGVRAVVAESYERIHRSNLVGMGILPLQFRPGESAEKLGLNGEETYAIAGLPEAVAARFASGKELKVTAHKPDGATVEFSALVRIDTPQEIRYYEHGGILPYVLRQLLHAQPARGGTA